MAIFLAATSFTLIVCGVALLLKFGPMERNAAIESSTSLLGSGFYWDALSATMALLIGAVGWTILGFACRNLDGEATQGRFLRWTLFTLGSVLMLVVSGNLLVVLFAWTLTSFGLHQLLRHYGDRNWAVWTARKKFVISRLGDLFLLAAIWLTYHEFGSFGFAEIFASADHARRMGDATWSITIISTLYVLGAMTKSAQFPFHTWLPDTLETPTAVSALMHAGIINAGGFLIIRLSPVVSLSPVALGFLAFVGGFTALLGGVMMLTQSSIKRQLAYSTIAQMGFMMLQCGLGAFSTAMLHLVAHSIYKAYAFLRSGSALEEAGRTDPKLLTDRKLSFRLAATAGAILVSAVICTAIAWLFQLDLTQKSGGLVLGIVLVLALATLLVRSFATGSMQISLQSVGIATLVAGCYFAAFIAMNAWLGTSVAHPSPGDTLTQAFSIVPLSIGFVGLFALESILSWTERNRMLQIFYVHSLNGFYLDIPARRLTGIFWARFNPVP
ncbi:proton-conducting transporter transmembrane domain-containing protein [Blastopirellula retiformator]|nr:proton-conducting transporter membrane subunit [Blastopirellula retiformator]